MTVWQTETNKQAIAALAKVEMEFEKKYTNVDLIIESVSWGDLSGKLTMAIKTNALPDIAHIQPFMAYSLVDKNKLVPITDLVEELDQQHGGILKSVKNLQRYDDEYYGIAYAVGSTFWSIRTDYIPKSWDINKVETWTDYLKLVEDTKKAHEDYRVILPGGSPFFIDQLYGELLANMKGRFFDPNTLMPEFESKENIAVLNFFRQLQQTGALDPSWPTTGYLQQFEKLAKGKAFSVPVTYARAAKTIENHVEMGSGNKNDVGPKTFYWLEQPTPVSGSTPISTIDCEPFVIFDVAANRNYDEKFNNVDLSKDFLRMFYSTENYHRFTQSVPVQLTPIFNDMANGFAYKASIGKWRDWHDKAIKKLGSTDTAKPIFMPDTSEAARKIPFLMEFQASRIVSDGVTAAILNPDKPVDAIANEMQQRALEFVNNQ